MLTTTGLPSTATNAVWTKLATTFAQYPRVIFGLANEPGTTNNTDTLNADLAITKAWGVPYLGWLSGVDEAFNGA